VVIVKLVRIVSEEGLERLAKVVHVSEEGFDICFFVFSEVNATLASRTGCGQVSGRATREALGWLSVAATVVLLGDLVDSSGLLGAERDVPSAAKEFAVVGVWGGCMEARSLASLGGEAEAIVGE